MTIFILFFIELMAMRYATFGHTHDHDEEGQGHSHDKLGEHTNLQTRVTRTGSNSQRHTPGEDHLSHTREHIEHDEDDSPTHDPTTMTVRDKPHHPVEDYAAQMTAIFILEFGVIFHSIFVGLTLAVTGSEFTTLYVVLVFHQTFEGLGLGSRLAVTPWPKSKHWTPYIFALGYGLSTPIAIAVGLGVRNTYAPGSQTSLIVNGVFDSISAGILIYTGLVELMAHEFMFSTVMRRASLRVVMSAFGMMCLGAGKSNDFPSHSSNADMGRVDGSLGQMGLKGKKGSSDTTELSYLRLMYILQDRNRYTTFKVSIFNVCSCLIILYRVFFNTGCPPELKGFIVATDLLQHPLPIQPAAPLAPASLSPRYELLLTFQDPSQRILRPPHPSLTTFASQAPRRDLRTGDS